MGISLKSQSNSSFSSGSFNCSFFHTFSTSLLLESSLPELFFLHISSRAVLDFANRSWFCDRARCKELYNLFKASSCLLPSYILTSSSVHQVSSAKFWYKVSLICGWMRWIKFKILEGMNSSSILSNAPVGNRHLSPNVI